MQFSALMHSYCTSRPDNKKAPCDTSQQPNTLKYPLGKISEVHLATCKYYIIPCETKGWIRNLRSKLGYASAVALFS